MLLKIWSIVMTVGLTITSALFFRSLPELSEIMQDKALQLLPHPQCPGKTKWSPADFYTRAMIQSQVCSVAPWRQLA